MKTVKVSVVTREWLDVPACPYCHAEPEITTKKEMLDTVVGKDHPELFHEVECPLCGLTAPLKVWISIAAAVDKFYDDTLRQYEEDEKGDEDEGNA